MTRPSTRFAMLYLALAALLLAIAGCANISMALSRGGSSLADARRARTEGRTIESLDYAVEAVRLDPKLVAGWEFLRDSYEGGLTDMVADLTSRDGTNEPTEAGRVAAEWSRIVNLNTKLKKLPLPYRDPSGWNWNPVVKDYVPRYKAARKRAFDLYFALGLSAVASGEMEAAKKSFQIALDSHADESSGERFQARTKAAAACIGYAQPLSQSFEIAEVERAVEAFRLALEYEPANARARDGLKSTSLRIADLYVAEGMSHEYKGSDEDLKEAVRLYTQSLVWNPEQGDAIWLLPRAKENLADRAYQRGRRLEEESPVSEEAVKAYREALGWVAGYRDSMPRVYLIPVRREVADLNVASAPLAKGFPQLESRATSLVARASEASGSVDRLRTLSSRIASLQARAARALRRLVDQAEGNSLEPLVSRLNGSFGTLLNAMVRVAATSGQGERILVVPLKDAVAGMSSLSGKVAAGVPNALPSRLTKAGTRIPDQVAILRQQKEFEQALKIVRELGKACPALAGATASLNGIFDAAEPVVATLAGSRPDIVAAEGIADSLEKLIKDLEDTARDLESVLRESVSVGTGGKPLSLTLRDALSSLPEEARPYTTQFDEAAARIIAPVRSRLSPAIPDAAALQRIADLVERFPSLTATLSGSIMSGNQALQALLLEADRAAVAMDSLGSLTGSSL